MSILEIVKVVMIIEIFDASILMYSLAEDILHGSFLNCSSSSIKEERKDLRRPKVLFGYEESITDDTAPTSYGYSVNMKVKDGESHNLIIVMHIIFSL